jgi:hypothetical protein
LRASKDVVLRRACSHPWRRAKDGAHLRMTAEIASQLLMMAREESATTHCNRASYCVRNRNHDEVWAGGGAGGVSTTGALRLA